MRIVLFTLSCGRRALVVNHRRIAETAPGDDVEFLPRLAENLAAATGTRLVSKAIESPGDQWTWSDLLQPILADLCVACGHRVVAGRCSNPDCRYHTWPQSVPEEDFETLSVAQLSRKHGLVCGEVREHGADPDEPAVLTFDAADFVLSLEDSRLLRLLAASDTTASSIPLGADLVAALGMVSKTHEGAEVHLHTDGLLWLLCKERYGVWLRFVCAAHGYVLPDGPSPDEAARAWVLRHNLAPLARRDIPLFLSRRFAEPLAEPDCRLVGSRVFSVGRGYGADEIEALHALSIGDTWSSPELGDAHTVTRLS